MIKLKFIRTGALALVAAIAATAGAAQANLLVNGDFSNPNTGGGVSQTASIPGWISLGGDSIEVGNSGIYGLPCDNAACQNLELNSNTFGFVGQVVGTRPGQAYNLSWDYGGRPGEGPQAAVVLWYDLVHNAYSVAGFDTGSIGQWTPNSTGLTANSNLELVLLVALDVGGNPSLGNEFTNFNLTAVPEPATWATMLLGLSGLGAIARVSRRKARAAA